MPWLQDRSCQPQRPGLQGLEGARAGAWRPAHTLCSLAEEAGASCGACRHRMWCAPPALVVVQVFTVLAVLLVGGSWFYEIESVYSVSTWGHG